jgi:PAS domain S-box-containing protein
MDASLHRVAPFTLVPLEERSALLRYGFALVTVAISTLLSMWLRPTSYATPFLLFFPAPLLSLLVGGAGPAWFSAVLSALAVDYFLLPPFGELNHLLSDTFFFLVFGLTAWLFDRHRKWAAREIERQRELLDASFDPICIRDKFDRVTFWNKGAERLFGLTSEEALGSQLYVLLKTKFPRPPELLKQEFLQRGHWSGELVHTKKDGTPIVVASYWTLKRDKYGDVDSSLIVNYDLTERKKLLNELQARDETLRVSEERLASIIQSAMDAIITLNRELRIIVFNAAAEEVFECPAEKALGQPIGNFIPERFRTLLTETIQRQTESAESSRSKYSITTLTGLRANGEEFPFEATISRNVVSGEKLFTVILRDVTRRKQTEAALIRSEKLASLGRLSASITHEMNNPLGAVGDLLYLLEVQPSLDDVARTHVRMAQREFARVVEIGRRTLGFSKGGGAVTRINVSEMLQSVLSLMVPKIREKSVTCETEFASNVVISGVETELRQVFWNLLNNALEAVPQGGRFRLRVSSNPTYAGRQEVRITVADKGSGIRSRDLPHLFEPFFTTKESGNGLGLWVISEILKKHGGRIKVCSRSEPNEKTGAVFSVVLPVESATGEALQNSRVAS